MKFTRAACALLCLLLVFPCGACGVKKLGAGSVDNYGTGGTLKPDDPAETGGVMRRSEEEIAAATPGTLDTLETDEPEVVPSPTKQGGSYESSPSGEAQNVQPAKTEVPADQPEGSGSAGTVTAEPPRDSGSATGVPEGSLAPFGAIAWSLADGKYTYDMPAQNTSGMASIDEMYSFPTTRFEDSNKPPDADNWFMGQSFYDEATGEATYGWDRWPSTLETLAKYGAIYRGDTTRKVCYLTFDCGYEYGATEKILDALRDKNAPGTFFLTGPYVRTQYDLIKRMLDEGHVVGNHTDTHRDMTTLTVDEVIEEMRAVERDYKELFPDAPDMLYFRPPNGAVNEWLLRIEAKLGYRTVVWSYTYKDYDPHAQWDYDDALSVLKSHLHPGCAYLLHAESSTNAAILAEFIDWIRAQGYSIEPLCGIE